MQDDPVALTARLVRIPSESSDPVGTPAADVEGAVAEALAAVLREAGLAVSRQPVKEGRANLIARLPREGAPRLLLTAHMDTVSARGMHDPFAGTVRDGRVLGRGACDDKGSLACAATALANAAATGGSRWDVTFLATVDEETSFAGAARFAGEAAPFDLILALEPTRLGVVDAHKGVYRFAARTRGVACHSAEPEKGRNAISAMLPVVADLEAYGHDRLPADPDPRLGRATLAVTGIAGGTAINIVPDGCEIRVDMRLLPGTDPDKVRAEVAEVLGGRAEVREILAAEGMRSAPSGPLWDAFLDALRAEGGGMKRQAVHYCTDASKFGALGPAVVWGPGDIARAHGAEECVPVDELRRARDVLVRLLG